jgi:hypothetical protein
MRRQPAASALSRSPGELGTFCFLFFEVLASVGDDRLTRRVYKSALAAAAPGGT